MSVEWPSKTVRFTVPFVRGKARPGYNKRQGRFYKVEEDRAAEAALEREFRRAAGGSWAECPPFVPVSVSVRVMRTFEGRDGDEGVAAMVDLDKPDLDNVMKLVKDGLTGVAYHDDRQVVEEHIWREWKTRGDHDEMEVTVTAPRFWESGWNRLMEGEEDGR